MAASESMTIRWPQERNGPAHRSDVKDARHQRPGLSRRVRSWSESISKKVVRSSANAGHKRYASTIQNQQTSSRPCSPCHCFSIRGCQTATVQTSKIKKHISTDSKIYHPSMGIIDENEHHDHDRSEKNNAKFHNRVLSATKSSSYNSSCNSSSTSSSQYAELSSKGSSSVSSKLAQPQIQGPAQLLENTRRDAGDLSPRVHSSTTKTDVTTHDLTAAMTPKTPPLTAKVLQNIFQDGDISSSSCDISDGTIRELTHVADFMFAAHSYHDSFKICQKLWSLIGPITFHNQSSNLAKPVTLWLQVAVGMVKSAQTPEDFVAVAQMMRDMPNRHEWPEYYKTTDYCMLYAFLSNICLDLADFPQAEKACLESWKHCQTLITKRQLVQYILSTVLDDLRLVRISRSATDYVGQKVMPQFKRRATVDAGVPLTVRQLNVSPPFLHPNIDQHVQEVLTWCVKTMSQQEIFYLIANIDVDFWSHEHDDHDVREFERCVVLCYLSERLRHLERSQKDTLDETDSRSGILWSFEQIHNQSGMSKMDILAAVTKALSVEDTTPRIGRSRATLPERYLQLIESLRKDMIIHNAGYARTGQRLTSQTLFEHYQWPGKSGHHQEEYHDQNYGRCVDSFLREFMITSLESNLTERLGQAFKCCVNSKPSQKKSDPTRSAEPAEWADDYRAFEVVARDICGDAAFCGPSYGAEEWIAQDLSGQVLFRYRKPMYDHEEGNSIKQEKQAFKTRNKGGISGWAPALGSLDTRGSSMMDFE